MFSIVIPACNEEALIGKCLEAVLADFEPGEFEVVVVCNGCTDNTAGVARSFGGPVAVVETPVPSKSRALNVGDQVATAFPRLYVDADVELSTASARSLARALVDGLAASPTIRLERHGTGPIVRSYLRIWEQLPVIRDGLVGRGVYGMSALGRSRFGEFPDVIGDDYFVHKLFRSTERVVVADATSLVRSPVRLRDLIRRKTRSYVGMMLRSEGTEAPGTASEWLVVLARDPRHVVDLPAYLGVSITARILARRRVAQARSDEWSQDLSTRAPS